MSLAFQLSQQLWRHQRKRVCGPPVLFKCLLRWTCSDEEESSEEEETSSEEEEEEEEGPVIARKAKFDDEEDESDV